MTGILVRFACAATAVVALGAMAGCSSGSSSTTTNTSGGGASGSSTMAAGGGGNQSSQLSSLASSVKAGEQATYKAVYTYTGSGSIGTITIEQKPPKSLFKSGDGEAISTGSASYYCSTPATGKATCLTAGTGSANPLAGITQIFNPEAAVTAIQAAAARVEAKSQGYNVSFSTQSFAGVDANCVTVTDSATSQTGKYCVTKSGILAYSGSGTANFMLTSFSSSVTDSDFSLPQGATIVTIPGVP